MLSSAQVAQWIPYPSSDAHKYSRGMCVLIAGSGAYPGAACLAARASQYAGGGYTHVFTDAHNVSILQQYRPSLVVSAFEEALENPPLKQGARGSFVIGPGFAKHEFLATRLLETALMTPDTPVLVDGGALDYLVELRTTPAWDAFVAVQHHALVLTPHEGEAQRLAAPFNIDVSTHDQAEMARALSACYNATIVLKGSDTVVVQGVHQECITQGSAVLAKAGTGDILAGLIGGLLAQGLNQFKASVLGVYLHAEAGNRAAERWGIVSTCAEEVLEMIPQAFTQLSHEAS